MNKPVRFFLLVKETAKEIWEERLGVQEPLVTRLGCFDMCKTKQKVKIEDKKL